MKFINKLKALFENQTVVTVTLALALIISATLCATQVARFVQYKQRMNTEVVELAQETPTPSPAPSAKPIVEKPVVEKKVIHAVSLVASSSEEDLSISLLNASGEPLAEEKLSVNVTPQGSEESETYYTDANGKIYIDYIEAGSYTIECPAQGDYEAAEPILCEVRPQVQREVVEVSEPVATVQEVAQETKTGTSSGEIEIGEIDSLTETAVAGEYNTEYTPTATPEFNTQTSDDNITIDIPEATPTPEPEQEQPAVSFDSPGVPHTVSGSEYSYTLFTDDAGYLYSKGAESVTNTLLVEEGYNVVYGLITTEDSSESVELIYSDGSVNEDYQIFAVENTEPAPTPTPMPTPEPTPTVKVGWQYEDGNTYFYDRNENRITGLNRIDGKLYFFSPDGACASRLGIDVSFFNGTIDWNAVKADGIDFAIIRVGGRGWSSGLLYDDTMSYQNLVNAKAAGLKIGVYFYSTAINVEEAIQEASLAIQNLHGIGLDFPIYFDTEHSGEYPEGRSDMLTAEQQTEIAKAFCDTVQNSGYRAGVYSGLYYYYSDINYGALNGYNIWLANYTRDYALPNFAGRYDMWQFTDSGRVNGIHGYVDMNVIF